MIVMIKILNSSSEFDSVIKSGIWFVDFNATWCMPCRMLEPVLEELSSEYNVLSVDIDKFSDLAMKYDIMSVPTVFIFKDGHILDRIVGLNGIDVYLSKIKKDES